jgi:hypothetical protein
MSDNLPGKGVFGWLGRQVGYVKQAVRAKPAARPPAKRSAPQSAPAPQAETAQPAAPVEASEGGVLYRHDQVQEAEHPNQPGVKLRRTIIDEVIVDRDEADGRS